MVTSAQHHSLESNAQSATDKGSPNRRLTAPTGLTSVDMRVWQTELTHWKLDGILVEDKAQFH